MRRQLRLTVPHAIFSIRDFSEKQDSTNMVCLLHLQQMMDSEDVEQKASGQSLFNLLQHLRTKAYDQLCAEDPEIRDHVNRGTGISPKGNISISIETQNKLKPETPSILDCYDENYNSQTHGDFTFKVPYAYIRPDDDGFVLGLKCILTYPYKHSTNASTTTSSCDDAEHQPKKKKFKNSNLAVEEKESA